MAETGPTIACGRPTIKTYLPSVLLILQCALLHPTFAHSRFTRLIRTSLTPINFIWCFTLPFRCSSRQPEDADPIKKLALSTLAFYMAIKSLEWGFASSAYYTRSLKTVDGIQRWEKIKDLSGSYKKLQEEEPCGLLKLTMWTLLHLSSQRGLHFTWGPTTVANTHGLPTLLLRLFSVKIPLTISLAFLVMTRDSPLGTPTSALLSLGVPNFPGLKIVSEALCTAGYGIFLASSMDLGFTFAAIVATLLYKLGTRVRCPDVILELVDPRYYVPIFNSPHKSSSVADFWGRGWHTCAQRIFLVLGGKPMTWLTKKIGANWRTQRVAGLFATFAASAIYHEYGVLAIAHSDKPHHYLFTEFPGTAFYFMVQPLAIIIEPYIIPHIPKALGGGKLWVWAFQILVAYPFRIRYMKDAHTLSPIRPLQQWTWMYILFPFEP
ncbi:hypothetical protein CROQUDRAFT_44662 [Cronartium quercuum f. sp. fusiforme G11]|uniref:Wax synthase domain-containing protein n=1 Tax=Cronartium quercuum f. sp. fusiforme G11 TaxID=708437 RepID=A0A9P6NMK7_9BASI|nr:hypothetical protein CROQUDRAFT_44662 [Cronartium quercuum f. sp. fusiforme G11]